MARPKKEEVVAEVAPVEEVVAEVAPVEEVVAEVAPVEEVVAEVAPVEEVVAEVAPVLSEGIKTNIISINIDGEVYEAKGGYISVPSQYVELIKSHG